MGSLSTSNFPKAIPILQQNLSLGFSTCWIAEHCDGPEDAAGLSVIFSLANASNASVRLWLSRTRLRRSMSSKGAWHATPLF